MKKVLVIGGGPGGYVAAIRAAELGAEVTLVEKRELGGTCLNRGCIPTKVLLHTAELYQEALKGASIGLLAKDVSVDWNKVQSHKAEVVTALNQGVAYLMRANKIRVIQGEASFLDKKRVKVSGTSEILTADSIIIAAGSEPSKPPIPGIDSAGVMNSDGALSLEKLPASLAIVGGGVIGMEFAMLYNSLGVKVTVIEAMPEILPNFDEEIVSMLKQTFAKKGVSIMTSCAVGSFTQKGDKVIVDGTEKLTGKAFSVEAGKVLVAVGRRPLTAALKLENAGIAAERGRITVNERMQTSVPGIYAIGDCASKIMLAHVASKEGRVAAENIMGRDSVMKYNAVPGCLYTTPEVSNVGLTEKQAKEQHKDAVSAKYSMVGNGKSRILGDTTGVIKVVFDKKTGEVYGIHMIGPRATELIAEAVLAIANEIPVDGIAEAIHAHPTVAESMGETAMLAALKLDF